MAEEKRLDALFYELASQDRLSILRELCGCSLKMQDIARKLDLTATEASRQLQRLSQAKLLERGPEGAYTTTLLGKLLLTLSSSMQLVYRYDDYFLSHDAQRVPLHFVNRLGELSGSTLSADLNDNLERWEKLIQEAEDHVWVMTPKAMGHLSKVIAGKLSGGLKVRSIFSEGVRESKALLPTAKNIERRLLADVPLIVMVSEKTGSVCFPRADGQVDFASFFGSDRSFMGYAEDLFLFYWAQGKVWV